ncbi:Type 1 glutamine amidotransferase-like domain-containing protein [Stomatobaculum longum]|uniref:Type 1 glutamine amidotransferase-like domain-containing protein n=1 Tax=Stomatobaculum longum TaxID=796942 RepID=UPI0028ECED41|nr:Type 1 glutamine amidotransferase-like domain-containing protein [Stomatobaculum longum]
MELLLVSYLAGTKTITANYLSKLSSKTITFIPTAGNVEPYTGFIDEGIAMLEELGYQLHMLDIAKVDESVSVQELQRTDCVCISGGNTFYLLQELKKKHLTELLASRIREGMFYIGESAGAIIAAPDIEYNQIMDDKALAPDLTDYSALSVFDHSVLPHLGEFPFETSSRETLERYRNSLKLIPLNNHEAVLVNDRGYTVLRETAPERNAL